MPTEQEILKLIRALVPNSKKYLHDDAAIIEDGFIVTTDTLVENTHFIVQTPRRGVSTKSSTKMLHRGVSTPQEIGWKAMAVNLSDIAAMGGKPLYALVSLSLPKNIKIKWIKNLYKGILTCAKEYKTQIIGGNLTRSKEINITITVIGKSPVQTPRRGVSTKSSTKMLRRGVSTKSSTKMLRRGVSTKSSTKMPRRGVSTTRSNAKPGDLVFTTGAFGDAAAKNYKTKTLPQIELGQKIIRVCLKHIPALMDASDGLVDCLIQISNESKIKIIVDEEKIPLSKALTLTHKHLNTSHLALYGGEDYELVGTASKEDCKKLSKLKGIKIIGEVLKGNGAFLKQKNNRVVKLDVKKAFKHFK